MVIVNLASDGLAARADGVADWRIGLAYGLRLLWFVYSRYRGQGYAANPGEARQGQRERAPAAARCSCGCPADG